MFHWKSGLLFITSDKLANHVVKVLTNNRKILAADVSTVLMALAAVHSML